MKRILFVDDEQSILDGLQNLLRKKRKVWDMHFALGAAAALEKASQICFDVLITDMRMPGMDGATLLEKMKAQHPEVVRLILSGEADQEQMTRALSLAQQYLHKPCDSDTLCEAIEKALASREMHSDIRIHQMVGRILILPSPKSNYDELKHLARQSDTNLEAMADIIARDPSMAAKLLQIVNSAFFGLPHHTASIRQAVAYLGFDVLAGLVTMTHMFNLVEKRAVASQLSLEKMQAHSLLVAGVARQLAGHTNTQTQDQAYTSGLLHDVGMLVLALEMQAEFTQTLDYAKKMHKTFEQVEHECLGLTHAEVGACLLAAWGLPSTVVTAIDNHHKIPEPDADLHETSAAVQWAHRITSHWDRSSQKSIDTSILVAAEVPPHHWPEILNRLTLSN